MKDTIKPLGPHYDDKRGRIQMIIEDSPISSVSVITSNKGSTRAGHYHKEDSHYCLVIKGEIDYYERKVGAIGAPITYVKVKKGELFYTPPMVAHEMYFPKDTEFYCFSYLSRANKNYEEDTTRLTYSMAEFYNKQKK